MFDLSRVQAWMPVILLGVLFEILGSALVYRITFDNQVTELRDSGQRRLDLYAGSLEREIGQYAYLPKVVGLNQEATRLLAHPDDARLAREVNIYLQHLSEQAGTMDIYLMTPGGRVIATSNWNQFDSFLGRDLSYRPYVKSARPGHVAEFYGIGTTHNDPGYYLASALVDGPRIIGVAAVKVSLDQLEKSWLTAESPALLSDENGVIVLSSVAAWKYATLHPMSASEVRHLDETQQYNRRQLTPLGQVVRRTIDDHSSIVELRRHVASSMATSGLFLAQTRTMSGTPWQLTVFYDLKKANDLAMTRAALAAVGLALAIAMLILFVAQRRAREVNERSSALSQANAQLQLEIRERSEAVRSLKAAQAELVQAGKLAVIGQMAAGIAHELNQPLAALGTLSANAGLFLERGDISTAQFNLGRIALLVQRMGTLTGQLRTFARRAGDERGPVDIAQSMDSALAILDQRLRKSCVELEVDAPEYAVFADGNAVRLEQVLVNLISNAIDASQGQPLQSVRIAWAAQDGRVHIRVADNGTGLSDEVRAKLFEPFFTTKANGLGLGLAISAGIIRDLGGELKAANREEGGAEFSIELDQSRQEEVSGG